MNEANYFISINCTDEVLRISFNGFNAFFYLVEFFAVMREVFALAYWGFVIDLFDASD